MVDVNPPGPPPANRLPPPGVVAFLAALLLFGYAVYLTSTFDPPDLFIYRLGAELVARGETPYDVAKVRAAVAARFPSDDPDPDNLVNNCGYFLPPLAVLLYLPLAALPWAAAKVAWAAALGLAGYCVARLPGLMLPPGARAGVLTALVVPFLLVANPLALAVVVVGQTSLVSVGCVAAGLWAFDRGRPYLGAVLWAVPFVKPHLALPLVPLAWYLGGWRPAALLVVMVGLGNAVGATIIGGSPLYLRDYLAYLPETRNAVLYNQAGLNPRIASWNRLLYAAGGPLVELSALTTAAGYLVWFGLVVGRVALAGARPSAAWAAGAAAVGAVLCAQVLVYELLLLAVVVPYVRDLFAGGHRLRAWAMVLMLAAQLVPQKLMASFGVGAHHPLGVALLAVLVLTGPLNPLRRAERAFETGA